ncbi:MAG: HK97 family phage prohead protease [Polyangiaceae bacterium]
MRAVRAESREVDFVCSTDSIDSYGERVEQKWILDRYLRNPVVLWNHNKLFQQETLPIGKAKNVGVVDGALHATIVFASEKANPMAERVWQSVQEQTLRAVSVGFNPRTVRYEKEAGEEILVLSDNDLFEISVTPIPANPDCLAKLRARALAANKHSPPVEQRGGAQRPTNTEKSTMDEITKAKAALEESNRALDAERTKSKQLEAQNEHLVKERDALRDRVELSEAAAIDRDVLALVGVKITPAEKEAFVELARSNRPLFEKMVAQRTTLGLLEPVVTKDPAPTNAESHTDDGESLGSMAARRAKSAA